jgi:hypothetical protein
MISYINTHFYEGSSWYVAVVKLVHIQHNYIFADGKWLEHCHVQDSGEALWYVVVLNQMRSTTCKTACPKQVIGILQLYNNGLAINLILLIGDSAKPL